MVCLKIKILAHNITELALQLINEINKAKCIQNDTHYLRKRIGEFIFNKTYEVTPSSKNVNCV